MLPRYRSAQRPPEVTGRFIGRVMSGSYELMHGAGGIVDFPRERISENMPEASTWTLLELMIVIRLTKVEEKAIELEIWLHSVGD